MGFRKNSPLFTGSFKKAGSDKVLKSKAKSGIPLFPLFFLVKRFYYRKGVLG